MNMKSITASQDGDLWIVRGYTQAYAQQFAAAGLEWQGRALWWVYRGAELPASIQQILDGTFGLDVNSPVFDRNKAISEKHVSQAKTASKRSKQAYSRKNGEVSKFNAGTPVEWDGASGVIQGVYIKSEGKRAQIAMGDGSVTLLVMQDMLRESISIKS